jgi:hypothetical protein
MPFQVLPDHVFRCNIVQVDLVRVLAKNVIERKCRVALGSIGGASVSRQCGGVNVNPQICRRSRMDKNVAEAEGNRLVCQRRPNADH